MSRIIVNYEDLYEDNQFLRKLTVDEQVAYSKYVWYSMSPVTPPEQRDQETMRIVADLLG